MPKAGFIVTRVSFLVLAASMLGAGMLAVPAVAQSSTCPSSGKCFAVTVSPPSPTAGVSTSFAFTITNEASGPQTLGSAQISALAGFVITSAPGATSLTSSFAQFTNLNLAPSTSTTLHVTATATCSGGTYQWGVQAKQSNNFNGPPGNDFQLDSANSSPLSGSVTGSCSLAFTSDGQPTDTAVAPAPITSVANSQGGPVKVEVLDGSGAVDTSSAAAVTMAIGNNPGSGSLSGTTTVDANHGVASFADLSINAIGNQYTLVATSPGLTSVSSNTFNITSAITPCTGTSCSGTASSKTTTGTVVVTSTISKGEFLETGIGGFIYSCAGGYKTVSDPFSFDLVEPGGTPDPSAQFSGTLRIDKSVVSAHPGASSWEICYASQQQFTPLPGTQGTTTIGGVPYFTGLLPDCPNTNPQGSAPCVQARNKNNAGDEILTFFASGDPVMKG